MLGGNISNKSAPILAFNIDNLLFKKETREKNIVDRIQEILKSQKHIYLNKEIDKRFVNIVNNLWSKYDFSIYFTTFSEYKEELYSILDKNGVNYTDLREFNSKEELRQVCNLQFTYYFDTDDELISYLGSKAIHISEITNIIK